MAILQKRDEDRLDKNYWKPQTLNEQLSGVIVKIYDKMWTEEDTGEVKNNGKVMAIRTSDDAIWETPTHIDLQEYIPQLKEGMVVTITLIELKDVGQRHPKRIYRVEV
jgi:hypothetical protein